VRTPLSELSLVAPRSLPDALRLLAEDGLTPLAGCTDLYVGLNAGALRERRFLDLWGLDALRGIRVERSGLRLGALTTYAEIRTSPLLRRWLPMLQAAAREIGGPQVQARGTLGGNVMNASPAGDTLPVLAVAEAVLVLESRSGQRRVPFCGFYTGYRQSLRRPDELLVALEIPPVEGRQWFRKLGTRAAQAISKVVMAGVRASSPRLAIGSVAPTVLRLGRTEAALAAGEPLARVHEALQSEIAPIDDVRSTAAYRRHAAGRLLDRFLRET